MNRERSDDRERWLDGVRTTYAEYELEGGRSGRWGGTEPGSRIAEAERDAWLSAALTSVVGGNVVDLGCGDGNLARTLDRHSIRPGSYLGIDVIPGRVSAARAETPWARFEVASADEVPVPIEWADAVVAMTLFSSILEARFRAAVAAEIERITRPGGRLVIYDIRYPSPSNQHVIPITMGVLARLFPDWRATSITLTLLPPLARHRIGGNRLRYRALSTLPFLRSHIGAILVKP